ncbi:hypothetical protein BC936DRAFT_148221 [Jimgerdemannia flammicorona]|uniref:PRP28/DDX23-like helical domain-containing protein n=1 Tax=Jimgerdemannia flammicorona TaxID=994334 RepID=A0A433D3L7_9FUNG|nr:hypothetical protein BC936DRAFT_148221 [Jimgerdemannia flammicorona]
MKEEARNHYNDATGETATIASNTSNVISAVRGITRTSKDSRCDGTRRRQGGTGYQGAPHGRKRKIRKMNEKVVFDWATDEDTSYDFNPLYANQHDARMFGRRHFAGMNIKDQIKQRSAFYNRMLEEPRTVEKDRGEGPC